MGSQQRDQRTEVAEVCAFRWRIGPRGCDSEMSPSYGENGRSNVTRRNDSGGIVGGKRNLVRVGELPEFGGETASDAIRFFEAKQDAAARFAAGRAMDAFDARNSSAGKQAANVDHLVESI